MKKYFGIFIFLIALTVFISSPGIDTNASSLNTGGIAIPSLTIDSGDCGENLTWALDMDGVLTISGTGNMYNWIDSFETPWYSHAANIKKVVIENGVASIGLSAFTDCTSLTSITIPSSITSIGGGAFYGCSSLTSITIPSSVASIEDHTFSGCSSLTSITIPSGVTFIGDYAFSGCSSLTSITIPSGVTFIGDYTFSGCSSLTSITIPSSVTSIRDHAFYGCSSLTSINIPSGVTSIGNYAFFNCDLLANIAIPSGVASIGDYAFYNCKSLVSIIIPSSVTFIGEEGFSYCNNLKNIYYIGTQKQWNSINILSGNDNLTSATLHLISLPEITKQPVDVCDVPGSKASFTIEATGEELTYTWYFKNPGATEFTKSAIKSSTYSVTLLKSISGREVYCVVTDKYGNTVKSDTVTLSLYSLEITTQPQTTCAKLGSAAKITVETNGVEPTYTWYFKNPTASEFTKSGITSSTYSVTMQKRLSGRQVYCVVTDKYGDSVQSDTVYLYLSATITKQPVSTTAASGSKATVSVTATGEGLTYSWYYKNPGGTFTKSEITSSTYSTTMQVNRSGMQVFCAVTDKFGNTVETDIVTIDLAATITKQPIDTAAEIGCKAAVSVTAAGDGLTYAWYFKNPAASDFTKSSITSSTYSTTMQKSLSGRQVYCIVTDKYGNTAQSKTVTLSIPAALKITSQPETAYASLNSTAKTTITAGGEGLKYTWYFKNPGTSDFTKSGVTSSTYSMTMQKSLSGRQVYCIVTDNYGNTVKSDTACLYLTATITKQPTDTSAAVGEKATVSVTAVGDGLTYTWYFKNPTASEFTKSGITSSTYSATMQKSLSGRQVYCVVTDKYGNSVKSNTVYLYLPTSITKQPTDTTAAVGEKTKVSVTAAGDGLTYTWYFKNPGSSSFTKSGITSSTYSMTMQKSLSGRQVYCVVTDKYGKTVTSDTVTITAK